MEDDDNQLLAWMELQRQQEEMEELTLRRKERELAVRRTSSMPIKGPEGIMNKSGSLRSRGQQRSLPVKSQSEPENGLRRCTTAGSTSSGEESSFTDNETPVKLIKAERFSFSEKDDVPMSGSPSLLKWQLQPWDDLLEKQREGETERKNVAFKGNLASKSAPCVVADASLALHDAQDEWEAYKLQQEEEEVRMLFHMEREINKDKKKPTVPKWNSHEDSAAAELRREQMRLEMLHQAEVHEKETIAKRIKAMSICEEDFNEENDPT